MPNYKFTNQENKTFEIPPGDYILEVVACEFGIKRESGDERMDLKLQVEGRDNIIYETLTFTEKAAWKIDTFVKSTNLLIDGKPPAPNQEIQFEESMLVGLRGWATIYIDEYPAGSGKRRNKVRVWITNKEKLPKNEFAAENDEGDLPPF